jgi:elongation factor Ts
VTGRVEKAIKTKLLLEQPYIRDSSMTVDEFIKGYTARLGENIKVARFVRFAVGDS